MINPDIMLTLAADRHRQLIAEGDRQRVLARARRGRRGRRARDRTMASRSAEVKRCLDGTLAPCGPRAGAQAR